MLPESPHALPVAELLWQLSVSVAEGLSDDEVNVRRKRFGPNTMTSRHATSAMDLLLHQFKSPVVYLLDGAAGLAFYFGELKESGVIIAVLAINALIGFMTELEAARSTEALRALGRLVARVRRESRIRLVPAERCATAAWPNAAAAPLLAGPNRPSAKGAAFDDGPTLAIGSGVGAVTEIDVHQGRPARNRDRQARKPLAILPLSKESLQCNLWHLSFCRPIRIRQVPSSHRTPWR